MSEQTATTASQCPQEERSGRRCRRRGKNDLISPSGYRTETPICGVHTAVLVRQGWQIVFDCWPHR